MKKIFVNLSNHALSEKQVAKAKELYEVAEFANWTFPNVDPKASSKDVAGLAGEFVRDIFGSYSKDYDKIIVHVMGESTFVYAFVSYAYLQGRFNGNITCVASTTERISVDNGDGTKTSKFEFCTYREY